MINDSERREVAATFRGLKEHIGETPLIFTGRVHDAIVLCAIRAVIGKGDIFERLADLIDRPTCKPVIPNEMEGYVFCPKCGAEISEYGVPNYCYNCGMEIEK